MIRLIGATLYDSCVLTLINTTHNHLHTFTLLYLSSSPALILKSFSVLTLSCLKVIASSTRRLLHLLIMTLPSSTKIVQALTIHSFARIITAKDGMVGIVMMAKESIIVILLSLMMHGYAKDVT